MTHETDATTINLQIRGVNTRVAQQFRMCARRQWVAQARLFTEMMTLYLGVPTATRARLVAHAATRGVAVGTALTDILDQALGLQPAADDRSQRSKQSGTDGANFGADAGGSTRGGF